MKLKGKKILVTGGSGYLGSHLIPALQKEGAIVFNISRRKVAGVNSFEVDLKNRQAVQKIIDDTRPDVIYHLAANINRDRNFSVHDQVMNDNYFATLNLLSALQDQQYDNFIFTSSSEIYGSNKPPFKEDQVPQPASPYSLSKVCAENAIATFSKTYNKNYTILRLFNFFGKQMPAAFFIPQMIEAFRNNVDFKMTKGEQARDFLYVNDIVQALLLAARNKKAQNQSFNVCSNKAVTLKALVKEVHANIDTTSKILFGALPYRDNEIWNMLGSNKKIVKELGFKIKYPFKKAVTELL